jgi:hypothetical protein
MGSVLNDDSLRSISSRNPIKKSTVIRAEDKLQNNEKLEPVWTDESSRRKMMNQLVGQNGVGRKGG